MGKFRLIEEVRKRPVLWNSLLKHRSYLSVADAWEDVASSLGDNVTAEICKSKWSDLRKIYRAKSLRQKLIEVAKRNGTYDPKKHFDSNWVYYEHMHFIKDVLEKNLNRKSEKTKESSNNLPDRTSLERRKDRNVPVKDNGLTRRSSTPEPIYYEIQIIDDSDEEKLLEHQEIKNEFCSNDDDDDSCEEYITNQPSKLQYKVKQKLSDTSKEDEPLNQKSCSKDSEFLNVDNICIKEEPVHEIKPDVHSMNDEESNIKSPKRQRLMQNIAKSNIICIESDEDEPLSRSTNLNRQESEDKSRPKDSTPSQQNAPILKFDIKEEPAIDIEPDSYPLVEETKNNEAPIAKQNRTENELESPKRQSANQQSTSKQKHIENTNLKTDGNLSLKYNNSQHSSRSTVKNINDPDYKFLLSFSSHLKSLTALQNLQFRAEMSNLILSFLKTSSPANELKIQESNTPVLSMDIIDPDCYFLSSFWPYMKSLNMRQNLQYRAKMSHLIIGILSKDKSHK